MKSPFPIPFAVAGLVVTLVSAASSPLLAMDAVQPNARLGRGVNLHGRDALWQNPARSQFKETHFKLIREAGFQHVRINLHPLRDGKPDANCRLREEFFQTMDWAVDQASANQLLVILDVHDDLAVSPDPAGKRKEFLDAWTAIAEHRKNRPDTVLFEILNEPAPKFTHESWQVPVIFRVSEGVRPNGLLSLYGEYIFGTPNVRFINADGSVAATQPSVQTDPGGHFCRVVFPAIAPGSYQLAVQNDEGWSTQTVYVNRADPRWISEERAYPGLTLKLIGRNLDAWEYNGPRNTQVRLVPVNGGNPAVITPDAVNPYCVDFAVPAGLARGVITWKPAPTPPSTAGTGCASTITVNCRLRSAIQSSKWNALPRMRPRWL